MVMLLPASIAGHHGGGKAGYQGEDRGGWNWVEGGGPKGKIRPGGVLRQQQTLQL